MEQIKKIKMALQKAKVITVLPTKDLHSRFSQ